MGRGSRRASCGCARAPLGLARRRRPSRRLGRRRESAADPAAAPGPSATTPAPGAAPLRRGRRRRPSRRERGRRRHRGRPGRQGGRGRDRAPAAEPRGCPGPVPVVRGRGRTHRPGRHAATRDDAGPPSVDRASGRPRTVRRRPARTGTHRSGPVGCGRERDAGGRPGRGPTIRRPGGRDGPRAGHPRPRVARHGARLRWAGSPLAPDPRRSRPGTHRGVVLEHAGHVPLRGHPFPRRRTPRERTGRVSRGRGPPFLHVERHRRARVPLHRRAGRRPRQRRRAGSDPCRWTPSIVGSQCWPRPASGSTPPAARRKGSPSRCGPGTPRRTRAPRRCAPASGSSRRVQTAMTTGPPTILPHRGAVLCVPSHPSRSRTGGSSSRSRRSTTRACSCPRSKRLGRRSRADRSGTPRRPSRRAPAARTRVSRPGSSPRSVPRWPPPRPRAGDRRRGRALLPPRRVRPSWSRRDSGSWRPPGGARRGHGWASGSRRGPGRSPAVRRRPRSGSTAWCDVRWEVVLGDEKFGLAELRELARLKQPLVRVRGQWVEMREEDIAAAMAAVGQERHHHRTPARRERSCARPLGSSLPDPVCPVSAVEADGWLGDLLGGAEDRRLAARPTPDGLRRRAAPLPGARPRAGWRSSASSGSVPASPTTWVWGRRPSSSPCSSTSTPRRLRRGRPSSSARCRSSATGSARRHGSPPSCRCTCITVPVG